MTRTVELLLVAGPEAPRAARRRVVAACRHLDASTSDAASLITSELVTNAVLHPGRRGPGMDTERHILVRLRCSLRGIRVEVRDDDPRPLPEPPSSADALEERGRGLYLVSSLASDWGSHVLSNGQKVVWFELVPAGDLRPSPAGARDRKSASCGGRLRDLIGTGSLWLRAQVAKAISRPARDTLRPIVGRCLPR